MRKIILILFIIVAAINLTSQIIENADLAFYSKPFLMPLLMIYFAVSSTEKNSILNFGLLALLFSWIGDVVLMFQERGELYFMLGLGSFLVAHLIYIYTYKKAWWEKEENGLLPTQRVRYVFILVLAGCGLVYVLLPKLGDLMVPVIIYASVIVAMAIFALNRFGYTSQASFGLVFFGAILFMMSDSILAVNKFMEPLSMAGFWIMFTYILAQFTIVRGLLLHKKRVPTL